ncbi:hypothetical protein AMTRI_Chr11g155770 [Amborella trichopoda]
MSTIIFLSKPGIISLTLPPPTSAFIPVSSLLRTPSQNVLNPLTVPILSTSLRKTSTKTSMAISTVPSINFFSVAFSSKSSTIAKTRVLKHCKQAWGLKNRPSSASMIARHSLETAWLRISSSICEFHEHAYCTTAHHPLVTRGNASTASGATAATRVREAGPGPGHKRGHRCGHEI